SALSSCVMISTTLVLLFSVTFCFYATVSAYIYTLSLHDALPISPKIHCSGLHSRASACENSGVNPFLISVPAAVVATAGVAAYGDRKSTRLNSSHQIISYAVFCLKKKKQFDSTKYLPDLTHAITT